MMEHWSCIIMCLAAWAAWAMAAGEGGGEGGDCASMADCGSCLRTPGCRWCSSGNVAEKSRCAHEFNIMDHNTWCSGFQWGPISDYVILKNRTDKSELYPQHAKLRLRVGETQVINITYKRLEDHPIDLYYLLDFSDTMKTHTSEISKYAKNLAEEMQKVTSNFRLGFGGFVDKILMPFVFTHNIEKMCDGRDCAIPYSFKNHFPLNNDSDLFSQHLSGIEMSINNDGPEGGLDALMQAIVCTEEIKWRPDARHFLALFTDAVYHIAGDGKLAGVVEPNPGKCMLNDEGEYIGYHEYDYPTISEVNKRATENKIKIIFAVTAFVSETYIELSQKIQGSSVEILSKDSKNIITLITEAYNKFEKSVKLIDDAGSRGIGIVYYSQCSGNGNLFPTNECNNIKATSPVTFQAHIAAKMCPPNLNNETWSTTINISPYGTAATFQLDLEIFCSCPCEYKYHKYYEENSTFCSNRGIRKCGICECDNKYTGETCECDRSNDKFTEEDKLIQCISNDTTKTICSDRGTCICGKCDCHRRPNSDEMFYGKYCQCDNFSCERRNGLLCSGRGKCSCGKCQCDIGWIGSACECPEMQTGCVAPGQDQVCSGVGKCVCGKCECQEHRSGKYCGDCMQTLNVTCPGGRCNEFAACVKCLVHEKSSCSMCSIPELKIEKAIIETDLAVEERYCRIPVDAGCFFVFTYLEEPTLIIRAVKTKECPSQMNLLVIAIGVGGTILFLAFIGILLWKLITTLHDRREYARYTKELENTKWAVADNPLHQEPTTTTMNPTYHSRRSRFSFMLR